INKPVKFYRRKPVGVQCWVVLSLSKGNFVLIEVFCNHKPGFARTADPHSFSLPKSIETSSVMLAQNFSIEINEVSFHALDILRKKIFKISFSDKTDPRGIFFCRCGEVEFRSKLSHFWFRKMTDRKKHIFKNVLLDSIKEIRLILILIGPF